MHDYSCLKFGINLHVWLLLCSWRGSSWTTEGLTIVDDKEGCFGDAYIAS